LAREYLEKQAYLLADAQGNKVMLAHSLLLLMHCTLASMLSKGIHAIVTLLEHEETSRTAEVVAMSVARRVDPLVDMMEHTAETIQESVMDTKKSAIMMYSTWEEVRDEIQRSLT